MLESGANMMQAKAPVETIAMYWTAFMLPRTTHKMLRWRHITTATR